MYVHLCMTVHVHSYNVPVLRTSPLPAAACCGGDALLVSLTIVLLVRLVVKLCP